MNSSNCPKFSAALVAVALLALLGAPVIRAWEVNNENGLLQVHFDPEITRDLVSPPPDQDLFDAFYNTVGCPELEEGQECEDYRSWHDCGYGVGGVLNPTLPVDPAYSINDPENVMFVCAIFSDTTCVDIKEVTIGIPQTTGGIADLLVHTGFPAGAVYELEPPALGEADWGVHITFAEPLTSHVVPLFFISGRPFESGESKVGDHPSGTSFFTDSNSQDIDVVDDYPIGGWGVDGYNGFWDVDPPLTFACCDPNTGECAMLTEDDCLSEGGDWHPEWETCHVGGNPCPIPTGACCVIGTCTIELLADCEGMNGVWQGGGTTCDPNPCPAVCCFLDAPSRGQQECAMMTEAQCAGVSGEWDPEGPTCEPNPCPQLYGACCFAGNCMVITEPECYDGGGNYLGDFTGCDPNPCPAVCCYDEVPDRGQRLCVIATADDCQTIFGGDWDLEGTTCDPNPCEQYLGACCFAGNCEVTTEPDCIDGGGIWQGDLTSCDAVECEAACCYEGDARAQLECGVMTEAECADIEGEWKINIASCDPNPCPVYEGACCVAGVCDMRSEASCENHGGVYKGDQSSCDPNPCAAACCVGPTCTLDPIASCEGAGGTWYQNIATCDPSPCPAVCCTGDDGLTCSVLTQTECEAIEGERRADYDVCEPWNYCQGPAPQAACCFGEECEVMIELACLEAGGIWLEQHETCNNYPCVIRVCCGAEGSYVGECLLLSKADCEDRDGDWLGLQTICSTDNPCKLRVCCEGNVMVINPHPAEGAANFLWRRDQCEDAGYDWLIWADYDEPDPCAAGTAANKPSWGKIKALYRP